MDLDYLVEDEQPQRSVMDYVWLLLSPITFTLNFLSKYGWYVLAAGIAVAYLIKWLKPKIKAWQEAREDAFYHKNPDLYLARMEAIQRAREKQQELLKVASERAKEEAKLMEERKRAEHLERIKKLSQLEGGHRLGTPDEADLPLSRGASSSSYRPPKRSACGGGGCGK